MLTVPHITCDPPEERRPDHFSVDGYDSSGENPSGRWGPRGREGHCLFWEPEQASEFLPWAVVSDNEV